MGQQLRTLAPLSEDPRFSSQYPHGGSQPSVTLVPGDLTPSSGLHRHQEHTQYTDIDVSKFPTHIK